MSHDTYFFKALAINSPRHSLMPLVHMSTVRIERTKAWKPMGWDRDSLVSEGKRKWKEKFLLESGAKLSSKDSLEIQSLNNGYLGKATLQLYCWAWHSIAQSFQVPCPSCVPSQPPAYLDMGVYGDDAVQALLTNT